MRCIEIYDNKIYTGHSDGSLGFWIEDEFSGDLVSILYSEKHSRAVTGIKADDAHLYSVSEDKTIKVWSRKEETTIESQEIHNGPIMCIDQDNKYIYTGSVDQTICAYFKSDLKTLRTIEGFNNFIYPSFLVLLQA